ncbi:ribonuclease H-like domain-containing protein [Tanacetum coccineum]
MEGVDRLNELKDEMLVNNIMSRLNCTTKELIITTATISKRWRNLWASLPHLIFSNAYDVTDFHGYISFIDNTLNYWIRYAISRNVEDVDLRLWEVVVGGRFSYEDELLFNASCITRMTLSFCLFDPPNGGISWERLECLCLCCVTLDEDMIQKILSGSPCMESLELKNCYGYRRIDVTSKSVKKLVFCKYNSYREICTHEEAYIDCVKINAPYISSLTIEDKLVLRELVLLDVSSLIKAELDYSIDWRKSGIFDEVFGGLLESLGHVENITFGDNYSEVMNFLLRVKHAKFVLDEARRWVWKVLNFLALLVEACIKLLFLITFHANAIFFLLGIDFNPDKLYTSGLVFDSAEANNTRCDKEVDRIKKLFDDCTTFLLRVGYLGM